PAAEPERPERPAAPEPPKPAPERAPIVAVAPPPPEPAPAPIAPEPEPEPTVVSLTSRRTEPREWNLWDLERLARDHSGDDAIQDEERSYLLMYLREFANSDGVLPADFDGVV